MENILQIFKLHPTMAEDEVIAIRRDLNPDKAFAPNGVKHKDLHNKSYLDVICLFEARVTRWYFDAAKAIVDNTSDYNFPVIVFCCIIIDLLSQHIFGAFSSSEKIFVGFCHKYLNEYIYQINPPIKSCVYKNRKWIRVQINDTAKALYHCFRCGALHSGRIYEYGRINELYPKEIIKIVEWKKGKIEINVHTTGLLHKLQEIFNSYIHSNNSKPALGCFEVKISF